MKKRKLKKFNEDIQNYVLNYCPCCMRCNNESGVFGKTRLLTDMILENQERNFPFSIVFHNNLVQPSFIGDYLVFIRNAQIPTILTWDGRRFTDDSGEWYAVTYWAALPKKPEV